MVVGSRVLTKSDLQAKVVWGVWLRELGERARSDSSGQARSPHHIEQRSRARRVPACFATRKVRRDAAGVLPLFLQPNAPVCCLQWMGRPTVTATAAVASAAVVDGRAHPGGAAPTLLAGAEVAPSPLLRSSCDCEPEAE